MAVDTLDRFEIGGEELLRSAYTASPNAEAVQQEKDDTDRENALDDIRIRIGTLLKAENVSFLLGAGASVESGGPSIASVPLKVEQTLLEKGISEDANSSVQCWLKLFYLAARSAGGSDDVPVKCNTILQRRDELNGSNCVSGRLPSNYEDVMSILYRWRAALTGNSQRLRLGGAQTVDIGRQELDECIQHATWALAQHCDLPTAGNESGLPIYRMLVRKLLTRPLNLKRVNLFTLNYDTAR